MFSTLDDFFGEEPVKAPAPKKKKVEKRPVIEQVDLSGGPVLNGRPVKEIIRQRRAQMLIHSCIYYELDEAIISDHRWQRWADELQELQEKYPNCCTIGFFDDEFKDWTGATGNHLPHRHPWVYEKSRRMLDYHRREFGDRVEP